MACQLRVVQNCTITYLTTKSLVLRTASTVSRLRSNNFGNTTNAQMTELIRLHVWVTSVIWDFHPRQRNSCHSYEVIINDRKRTYDSRSKIEQKRLKTSKAKYLIKKLANTCSTLICHDDYKKSVRELLNYNTSNC